MEFEKSDKKDKISENKSKKPDYVKYLIGLAILLFAFIIGYNAFIVPDVDDSVQTVVDDAALEEKNVGADNAKININKAKKEELEKLSGVGWQTALKIIQYRETHGGFSSKEELMEVSGIGEKIFEKIKDSITI